MHVSVDIKFGEDGMWASFDARALTETGKEQIISETFKLAQKMLLCDMPDLELGLGLGIARALDPDQVTCSVPDHDMKVTVHARFVES